MCGILGRLTIKDSDVDYNEYKRSLKTLYRLSASRGKEASGLCCVSENAVNVLKADIASSQLVNRKEFMSCMDLLGDSSVRFAMGHSRMITNGDATNPLNNQPVVRNDLVLIHNGIIVNDENIWKNNPELERKADVDTEVLAALLEKNNYKEDFISSFFRSIEEIEGSISIALIDKKSSWLFLYTNVGSLYVGASERKDDYIFASERYILEKTMLGMEEHRRSRYKIFHLEPQKGIIIDFNTGHIINVSNKTGKVKITQGNVVRDLNASSITTKEYKDLNIDIESEKKTVEKLLDVDLDKIHKLKRCTKCLLPETFPGISYDANGVCSVCNNYKRIVPKGREQFAADLNKNRKTDSRYDCIAPISGGRDSCYILHYLVKEMNLKPVAYTYDWGLVTDLARRNIQRMCASLGVEHVLISADIRKKRENVKKNVEAWLKQPDLGMVPLFMAGDKHFFYYAQLLKRQMKVDNVIFGMNALEETQFKAGFIMHHPENNNDRYYDFSGKSKLSLMLGYGKGVMSNPKYINSSIFDGFAGFLSYYAIPQDYLRFFNYIPWDQDTIESILINKYNWETAKDTEETWRIGDGTAPFYNYIYYRMAGFTEFDTFKSNQIREGMITREEAMKTLDKSNQVSVDGFIWYCNTIGIDPVSTLKIINQQKTLY